MARLSLIALHGNGGGGFRFSRLIPHLPGDILFHAPTLPGFAGRPRDPSFTTLAHYARHLLTELDPLPRPRVLLGHGIGGSLALEFLQHHAPALDAVILHAPVGAHLDRRLFPKLMSLPGARRLGQSLFASPLTRPLFRRLLFSRPVPADFLDRFFDEYDQCTAFGQMFDLITARWFASLAPVSLPAFLVWGERERVLSADQLPAFLRLLPLAESRLVSDWDHFPMIEQPEEYAREISSLARHLVL
ncbi:MAG: alpha/beta hydrolase [Bryobacteraceae bacterium]|nr:alpha/beta hydrolase [Bryobacteraceae bacterium]